MALQCALALARRPWQKTLHMPPRATLTATRCLCTPQPSALQRAIRAALATGNAAAQEKTGTMATLQNLKSHARLLAVPASQAVTQAVEQLAGPANIAYVGAMLYGFVSLPPEFMLSIGMLTLVVRARAARGFAWILISTVRLAAVYPSRLVAFAWVIAASQYALASATIQELALRMGLVRSRDPIFDWPALWKHIATSPAGREVDRLTSHLHLAEALEALGKLTPVPPRTGGVLERLDRIEAKLDRLR